MSAPAVPAPPPGLPANPAKLLGLAVGMGIGGALVASLFLAVLSVLQGWVWVDLPAALNLGGNPPLWYLLGCAVLAAGLVAIAQRLPGKTGGTPLTGLHFDIGPREIGSVVVAALATLALGMPLGPEAPLIACGTALGAVVARKADGQAKLLAMLLGGAAAIGAIFGNPFITAFVFLEFAALGLLPAATLLPLYISLGTGYLVSTGLGGISGLGTHSLSVPGLTPVDQLPALSLLLGLVVAVVAGAVTLFARDIGWITRGQARRTPVPVLFAGGVAIAVIAYAATTWSGLPVDTVLFSGEEGIPALVGSESGSALLIVTVARVLVYGIALGAGFRGGPIFPSIAIGVGAGAMVAMFIDPALETPLVVAGIAAAAAAGLKLPFTAGLLAVLITSSAGIVTAPEAILGAVVGLGLRLAHDKRWPPAEEPKSLAADDAPAPASTTT